MLKKIIAFSLAEVLMVAAIAGIVGALTIPNMKKAYDKKARIAKAKTTFATLDSAISQIDYDKTFRLEGTESVNFMNELQQRASFRHVCGSQKDSTACFPTKKFTESSSEELKMSAWLQLASFAKICSTGILKNGTEIAVCVIYKQPYNGGVWKDYYGFIVVDVNGAKVGSQVRGEDIFVFKIGTTGIIPFEKSTEANIFDE